MSIKSEIWILVGPPCSGKSTFSRDKIKKNKSSKNVSLFVRVNKDDLRKMLHNNYKSFTDTDSEKMINRISNEIIIDAETYNRDIIVDNTHCKFEYLKELFDKHKENNSFVIVFFDIPLWKLKLRNIRRFLLTGRWIPIKVLKRMYGNYNKLRNSDKLNQYNNRIKEIIYVRD